MAQLTMTFGLAVLSVSLWTLRVAVTARGNRILGSGIAMVEALTFVTVYSHVVNSADGAMSLIVYGLGVGVGTFAGVSIDQRIRRNPGKPQPCGHRRPPKRKGWGDLFGQSPQTESRLAGLQDWELATVAGPTRVDRTTLARYQGEQLENPDVPAKRVRRPESTWGLPNRRSDPDPGPGNSLKLQGIVRELLHPYIPIGTEEQGVKR